MTIEPLLLEMLVCPLCKEPVALTPDERALKCPKCRRLYAINDGIPNMLVDEAVIEQGEPGEPGPA